MTFEVVVFLFFFFFNDTATTEIYTLSLHDALPIFRRRWIRRVDEHRNFLGSRPLDRKSTRLNSSHQLISYAVFCLKKKKNKIRKRGYAQKDCLVADLIGCEVGD